MSIKTFAIILAAVLFCGIAGFAQESRGTITGRVVDASGATVGILSMEVIAHALHLPSAQVRSSCSACPTAASVRAGSRRHLFRRACR